MVFGRWYLVDGDLTYLILSQNILCSLTLRWQDTFAINRSVTVILACVTLFYFTWQHGNEMSFLYTLPFSNQLCKCWLMHWTISKGYVDFAKGYVDLYILYSCIVLNIIWTHILLESVYLQQHLTIGYH